MEQACTGYLMVQTHSIERSIPTCRVFFWRRLLSKQRTQKKPLLFFDRKKKAQKNHCFPIFGCCQSQQLSIVGFVGQTPTRKKKYNQTKENPNLNFNSKELLTYLKGFFPMNHL